MTSLQRVEAVLAGQIPDRVPVCLHNFLLATKEAGIPLQKNARRSGRRRPRLTMLIKKRRLSE